MLPRTRRRGGGCRRACAAIACPTTAPRAGLRRRALDV